MLDAFRSRLTYANVASSLALIVALGGTSYAAVTLPKNSVKARQIAPNAVKASETARNSLGSPEVIDGSLLLRDFKVGQVPAGAQGEKGDKGDKGDPGPPGDTSGVYAKGETARVVSGRLTLARSAAIAGTELLVVPGFGKLRAFCRSSGNSELGVGEHNRRQSGCVSQWARHQRLPRASAEQRHHGRVGNRCNGRRERHLRFSAGPAQPSGLNRGRNSSRKRRVASWLGV